VPLQFTGRVLSLGLVLSLALALYLVWNLDAFRVSAPLVTGNVRLSAEEIEAALAAGGQPIFMLQPAQLATRLRLNYPELRSAQVTVYFPNTLWVRVSERAPIILWQTGDRYTWIDESGIAFRPRGQVDGLIPVAAASSPPGGVPILDDPLSPDPYLAAELVEAIRVLAPSVPGGTAMTYDAQNGLGWQDARGWQVSFGSSAKDIALKLRVYQSLTDSLSARGLVPEFISVAYPDAPFYRMAEGTESCSADGELCAATSDE